MNQAINICIVCAWRQDCQKKFSISGKDIRCPDFVKDLLIKDDTSDKETAREEKNNK